MRLRLTKSGRRLVLGAALSLGVSAYALAAPMPAGAQTPQAAAASGHQVQLLRVNSTNPDDVAVDFRYDGPAGDVAKTVVKENGQDVKLKTGAQPLPQAKVPTGVMFVVDTSASTDQSGTLTESKKAIKQLVEKLPKGEQVALVAAGSDALLAQRFTTDIPTFEKALDGLTPGKDGGLWAGVARGASEITGQPDMIGSLVLVTDGNSGTGVPYADAKGEVLQSGAPAYVFAVQSDHLDANAKDLASATGGTYQELQKATDLTGSMTTLTPQLTGLYRYTYSAVGRKGVNDLVTTVGDATAENSYVVGADARGASALQYAPPSTSSGFAGLQNDFGKYLAVVLALLAAGLLAYGVISIAVRDQDGLASVLQPYSDSYTTGAAEEGEGEELDGMAQTAVVQRAVEMTRQFAEKRGFLTRVEAALERANLPLRAAEAMFFYVAAAFIVALLAIVVSQNALVVLIVLAIVVMLPPATLNYLAGRRRRQFEAQLPDMLQLLSGTLRAGYSMMQGVEAVSQEVAEPMGRELRRVITEARLGRPLEESLDAVAERMNSLDFGWAVMAISIQREVGGNLSELLMTVAETMTQRERLRRDVKSLTAEGRISAYVLAVLPFALGIAMAVINPDYMKSLFDETVGRIMLGGGLLLMVGGFLWMQAIVKIDV